MKLNLLISMTGIVALSVVSAGCSKNNFQFEAVNEPSFAKLTTPEEDDLLHTDPTPIPEPPPAVDLPPPVVVTPPAPTPVVVVPPPTATPIAEQPPVEPPPVVIAPTPTPLPAPTYSSGSCAKGQAVSSCMSCDYTVPAPQPWQPSTKAEKLAEINFLSCPIKNKSDPATIRSISQLEALSMVQACTPAAYPESAMYDQQALTMAALLGDDPWLRNKIYSGLWFQPPYTDHFEEYFGVYHADIRRVFCDGEDPATVLAGLNYTKEYYDRCYGLNQCDPAQWPKASRDKWNAMQAYRTQLRNCMTASKGLPNVTSLPGQPSASSLVKTCSWKKFDGYFELGGKVVLDELLAQGYKISLETGNSCQLLTSSMNLTGFVSLTGFKCQ